MVNGEESGNLRTFSAHDPSTDFFAHGFSWGQEEDLVG